MSAVDAGTVELPGRTTVSARAIRTLSGAVAAEAFGVSARAVNVGLSDLGGLLAIRVETPIRVPPLNRLADAAAPADGTVMERAALGQGTIHQRVTELTGAEIAHVTVHLTGVEVANPGRVR